VTRRLDPDEEHLWRSVTGTLAPEPTPGTARAGAPRPGARRLKPDEERLWHAVTATFYPTPVRLPATPSAPPSRNVQAATPSPKPKPFRAPGPIEPGRSRQISRERQLEARIDLHGLDQDRAREVLTRFIERAHDEGYRAALVITGKGVRGDGVLRHRAPEWLASPALRHIVAGISPAHRRHGGEGALYVALKRRARP
jgi:DNA-nicking Smr family endonuclease